MTGRGPFRLPSWRGSGTENVPGLSAEEVERRSGGIGPDHPAPVPDEAYEITQPVQRIVPEPSTAHASTPGSLPAPGGPFAALDTRRRVLWRDSATILVGVALALLAFQVFVPRGVGVPAGSSSELPSGIASSVGPPISLPPAATFGPIIDPGLEIDATPTPIPVITLGPRRTAAPTQPITGSPRPSLKPTPTIRPRTPPPPSATPTLAPTDTPPPTDPPTDPPSPGP